jgi:DNA replication protein DnaC
MNDQVATKLKYLRLGGLLAHWDDYLKLAGEQRFSHGRLLTHIVDEEYRLKQDHARQLRHQHARLPEPWVIETFPFQRQPKLNKKKIMALYDSMDYLTRSQNIIWLGGTGVGKTGLALSFLVHALNHGYSGRYVMFAELVAELYQSVADHTEEKVLRKYVAYDTLAIDEIGYVEAEPVQVGLFFTLMQRRHKKRPTLITSNLGFSDWSSFLKNAHLTAALIDRLTDNSYVFNMRQCESLRPKLPTEA